ncbi:DNA-3-methyladenine glycosylase [Nocardioides donggukensis]|uniref:Putative 3-methyladenine DNA glycosylase n=1 Tax=Nocardioides donggukensis TaxID=2774019 RepID=A0A927Q224_9ACTN|nr:DNA-3-methyladenine glycosylase [Nocardioides donggukensis]MBD8869266.1 DNA-3-methyladenine glycosylase [Nocardioides donggukensis]
MGASADLAVLGGDAPAVAPLLLGAVVRRGEAAVRLTEVEAYAGARDPGSHAFRGRTPRNAVMFGPAGHLYTYFVYGMHVCANVVTGPDGEASAVLLRAGEVVTPLDPALTAAGRRDLARGPARLCRALGIGLADGGTDLRLGPVTLELGDPAPPEQVRSGPRVGLRNGAATPWRFWLDGEPTVSQYRPAARRRM